MAQSFETSIMKARIFIAAIERHEKHEPFLSFSKGVVTVLVGALDSHGEAIGKDQLLLAIEQQGANIPVDEWLEADVAKALSEIQRHDRIHFQMMMTSAIAAIQVDCH